MFAHGKMVIVALFACALFSCASSSVTTNKDAANVKPIGKTYIVVNTGDVSYFALGGPKVGAYLSDYMVKSLKQRSVESRAAQLGGLELDQTALMKDVSAYGASTVISIELTDGMVNRDNVLARGNFIVSVFDVGINKTVWKAKLAVQSSAMWNVVGSGELDDLVKKFLDAMKDDGLFLGEAGGS
jgi:hypothetical protein